MVSFVDYASVGLTADVGRKSPRSEGRNLACNRRQRAHGARNGLLTAENADASQWTPVVSKLDTTRGYG
jgi:hypothetical protein